VADAVLGPGISEQITVTAESSVIDKDSATIASALSNDQILGLPLAQEYRDIQKLIPGVQYTEDATRGPSAGGSGQDNVYRFDGVDVYMQELRRAFDADTIRSGAAHVAPAARNPYKGLRPFGETDAADFFGRDDLVAELVDRVSRNNLTAVVGPSGSGKSSLVRALLGLIPMQGGKIVYAGETLEGPVQSRVLSQRRDLQLVFQDPASALNPAMRVSAIVSEPLLANSPNLSAKSRGDHVIAMLNKVGLDENVLRRFPHQLSGGQAQRVALARALAPRPTLLLLDEPFSNLDVELREQLSVEVRDVIKASGATAVLVTHDQQEAFAMADEIGVMNDGRIAQWDSPYALYHEPVNRFVADFVGQGVFLPAKVLNAHRVEIELGVLDGNVPHACRQGCDACGRGCIAEVLLRPDDVVHDDASSMKAEVVKKAFRGADILYTLRLDSGRTVLALVPSHHNHAIGERIGIRLDVDHVVAFEPLGVSTPG